jgi:hypothetical protein
MVSDGPGLGKTGYFSLLRPYAVPLQLCSFQSSPVLSYPEPCSQLLFYSISSTQGSALQESALYG